MPAHLVDHPLAATRLAVLRDGATRPAQFRSTLRELAGLLTYEACRELPTVEIEVLTPLAATAGRGLLETPVVVPVLRAGLGMLEGTLALLPDAQVGFVGLKRDEHTLLPDSYVTALPDDLAGRRALVLDPMLATGGSLVHTLRLLAAVGVGPVAVCCVLAAPEGLAALVSSGFGDVAVFTAAIDSHLNEIGFIVPGLGDAGDRQFGAY